MLTDSGKKIIVIGLVAAIAYYVLGPGVALVLLCKKSKDLKSE